MSFSSLSFSPDAFSAGSFFLSESASSPEIAETTGGIPEHERKKYRKYLERLEKLTRQEDITARVISAAQEIADIPVDTPEIAKIAANPDDIEAMAIDYAAIASEIAAIQAYLEGLSAYSNLVYDYLSEQDDEIALLLMIN